MRDKPRGWEQALFASILVQRRTPLLPRLRDSALGFPAVVTAQAFSGRDVTCRVLGFIDEADAEDARWLEHDYVTHVSERAHAWVDEQEGWTYVWQEECRAFDAPVLVSEEQMSALRSEMEALLGRYRRMGAGTPGARRVAVTVIPLPLPPS